MTIITTPTVGFIGLGSMGSGMTHNLQRAGFPLVITDLNRAAAADLVAAGARWAGTAAEVAASSDLVITMLPTPRHVNEVATSDNGILAGIKDGGTWVDMSTSIPEVTNTIREATASRNLRILDAPVSGMSAGAAAGTLQIFIGGEAQDVTRLRPVFEAMGDSEKILHVGGYGAGYAVKLMINQLWFSHLVATAEVLSVGVRAGVDLGVLRNSLIASPANSTFVERDVLSILERGDYDEGFALALACKDLSLSSDLARSVGVSADLSALVEQIFSRARVSYGDHAGEMAPFQLYEDSIGTPLRFGTPGAEATPGSESTPAAAPVASFTPGSLTAREA
ncbi:NAD(P)-dependent oxidoreductase [Lysinibacter sp. HNR]|uniref:NAD(P)-dependent oxidoreductase n=1 Tax=Lysinibacter sp. HNR TaxID=3031408 RepID=UPI00243599AD|nr:NAD(P)-dependent oxidoreductase [Lysinibacter sp. HNR]WGD37531.1 NAD(P)-dependent oxidoreductase [Lysinibacter sp. HNR]